MDLMYGKAMVMSSGCASLFALYSGNSLCLNVPPLGSNATAICVGFCFLRMSQSYLTNPVIAEVFMPLEFIKGLLINA